jgi:hypothetical protein
MITSTSQPRADEVKAIYRETLSLAELTPRTLKTLEHLAEVNRLAIIKVDGELAGWAAVEQLTRNLSELGMVYVKPAFRCAEAFGALIREVAKHDEPILLATYNPALIRYATKAWNGREIGLAAAIKLSHGKFLTKRLGASSRKSIKSRIKTSKPRYALIERR